MWSQSIGLEKAFNEAYNFCNKLTENSLSWKLPSISDFEQKLEQLKEVMFEQTKFWSNSEVEGSSVNAWLYDVSQRYKLGTDKEYRYSVVCIRD